ncbi:MAG: exodeoxyribonuclease III [Rhodomicrobiaceae bacterium]
MKLKLATWNINSVRLRIDSLAKFAADQAPDIIALQEIKCANEHFPLKAINDIGYEHVAYHGQKSYHGVAILSKIPLETVGQHDFNSSNDTRHLAVKLKTGSRSKHPLILHNFYIPAGGDIPDREKNIKFGQKLDYLTNLTNWFEDGSNNHSDNMIMVGDFNIAPLETDVWSHKQLLKVVSHTPIEVEHLNKLQATKNWHDIMRTMTPEPEPLYTWWSYRAKDWKASNRGRRLDHIWTTPKLAKKAKSMEVITEMRSWEKASDHAPVIANFEL